MILTGPAVRDAVASGAITIDPFDPALLNPNSYNYRLGSTLKTLVGSPVDPRREAETESIEIGPGGYVLQPRTLYLGVTVERIGSAEFVTSLIGRSSIGRLGTYLQVSADLGQLGAIHQWTLEIVVVQPLRVYAGMRIGQVSFWRPRGRIVPYGGYYGSLSEPSPCSPHAAAGTHVREVAA
ncbi:MULTISPECIES: deoxycytidine deaminase [unclassified Streptomyces]|uniref:dCTP deaminase n=1 Tax=unclassified Streptomyces TaxID=2593676 RepID=UPI000DC7B3F5|nr:MULTISPECIES: deoxycytidine deaminase [unclassified Streptomyces]AWZ03554.1 deoxycytidine deaminase [Streptomyces sp. ICC4]AWZ12587.1 deoxycytidine deaminase [Streptomyces sp. ICC1]